MSNRRVSGKNVNLEREIYSKRLIYNDIQIRNETLTSSRQVALNYFNPSIWIEETE